MLRDREPAAVAGPRRSNADRHLNDIPLNVVIHLVHGVCWRAYAAQLHTHDREASKKMRFVRHEERHMAGMPIILLNGENEQGVAGKKVV